jgi:hypothetical protein
MRESALDLAHNLFHLLAEGGSVVTTVAALVGYSSEGVPGARQQCHDSGSAVRPARRRRRGVDVCGPADHRSPVQRAVASARHADAFSLP